jgi:hypothetical protein
MDSIPSDDLLVYSQPVKSADLPAPRPLSGWAKVPHELSENGRSYGLIDADIKRICVLIALMKDSPIFAIPQKLLARRMGVTVDSLQRFLKRCSVKGLVTWRQRQLEDGSRDICEYDCSGLQALIDASASPSPAAAKVRYGVHGSSTSKRSTPSPQNCGDMGKTVKLCDSGDNNSAGAPARGADQAPKQDVVVSEPTSSPIPEQAGVIAPLVGETAGYREPEPEEVGLLVEKGVAKPVAWNLYRDRGGEIIRKQITCLPFRPADDPVCVLVKSIQGDWSRPGAQRRAEIDARRAETARREADKRKEERRMQQELEQRRRKQFEDLAPEEIEAWRTRAVESYDAECAARGQHSVVFWNSLKDRPTGQNMIRARMKQLYEAETWKESPL